MDILVDSDIIIDFLNNQDYAVNFFKKENNKEFFISIISWIEVVYGFKKTKINNKKRFFEEFLEKFRIIIAPIDKKIAEKYLDVKIDIENKRESLADFDLLIAATAIVNNLILATRNTKHFKRIKELKLFL